MVTTRRDLACVVHLPHPSWDRCRACSKTARSAQERFDREPRQNCDSRCRCTSPSRPCSGARRRRAWPFGRPYSATVRIQPRASTVHSRGVWGRAAGFWKLATGCAHANWRGSIEWTDATGAGGNDPPTVTATDRPDPVADGPGFSVLNRPGLRKYLISGGRYWDRTSGPCRVKAVLYR